MEKTGLYSIFSNSIIYELFQNIAYGSGKNKLEKDISAFLSTDDKNNTSILDIGCGMGKSSVFLSQFGKYTGIDYNRKYITYAQRHYATFGNFLCADITNSNLFADASYNIIYLMGVLHHLPDRQATNLLLQCSRMLSYKGVLIAHDGVILQGHSVCNFIARLDRGPYVRNAASYYNLFPRGVEIDVSIKRYCRIPYIGITHIMHKNSK